MEFYKTEIGKILAHGIHENNSSVSQIKQIVAILREESNDGTLSTEDLGRYLTMLESAAQKSQDGMDYVYSKIKEIKEV